MRGHSDCYCAPGVLLGLINVNLMGTCRVPCGDDENVSCGGDIGPIVYSANAGGIFAEVAARLALPLPVYECQATCKFLP